MRKTIAKMFEIVIWFIRPHILVVDKEFAEHLTKYGGAKVIGGKRI